MPNKEYLLQLHLVSNHIEVRLIILQPQGFKMQKTSESCVFLRPLPVTSSTNLPYNLGLSAFS